MPSLGELPPGPSRTLVETLHTLYDDAGRPGLREIATEVTKGEFRDTVSHEKVSAMLRGKGILKWSKYEPVVRVLALWATPERDAAREARRFKKLWDAASAPQPTTQQPVRREEARLRSAFVLGGITAETDYPTFEPSELERFCHQLGAIIADANVDLVICSPFPDSADYYALRGYLTSRSEGTVHMHSPHHPDVEEAYKQLRQLVGPTAAARIRNWWYPGPETTDPDALGQAWLLCQLMAAERADVVMTVGGKKDKTASTILHLAEARRQPVVPFTFLGGAAERAYARRDWARTFPTLDAEKLKTKDAAKDAVIIANEMMTTRMREEDHWKRPETVFISRASLDVNYARGLDDHLTKAGLTVLFGERDLPKERTVESAIEDAVLRSDLFIVLWSRHYAASRYCYDEIHLALQRHRAGELQLWIINIDGSDIVPPEARGLPQMAAKTPEAVISAARDLLDSSTS
jgi:hypothetical protein